MIKRNKWSLLLSSLVILLPMVFGLIVWDALPEQIATHWNAQGDADGWSSRAFAVFGMPLFLFVLHWVCVFVTTKDPKQDEHNFKSLWLVLWITPSLSVLCNGLIYAAAFEKPIAVEQIVPFFMGLLFAIIGNYIPKFKQNYTVGIKIIWTLHSEENWNATHRFTGKVWMIGGIAIMLCSLLPGNVFFWVFGAVMLVMVAAPFLYSYNYHRKHG